MTSDVRGFVGMQVENCSNWNELNEEITPGSTNNTMVDYE